MLTHILQSVLFFAIDLALAFPALLLAKRQSPPPCVRNIAVSQCWKSLKRSRWLIRLQWSRGILWSAR